MSVIDFKTRQTISTLHDFPEEIRELIERYRELEDRAVDQTNTEFADYSWWRFEEEDNRSERRKIEQKVQEYCTQNRILIPELARFK